MEQGRRRNGRRWLLAAGIAVVLIVAAVVVVKDVVFRDQARAVSTDEAVTRYRAEATTVPATSAGSSTTVALIPPTISAATTTAPASTATVTSTVTSTAPPSVPVALVPPGVYRYTTTGQEHVDALKGATHTYPAETTITVVPDGCGVSLRWDALKERWDQWHLCATPAGVELETDGIQYHEFFNQPDNEAIACQAPVMLVPAAPSAPAPQQRTCTLAADPWLPIWTILERGPRTVDGHEVDVQHVQMQIEDDDQYWEHTTIDWYLALDGLPVQVVATKSSLSSSPIGDIQYDEHFQLDLESLTPLT